MDLLPPENFHLIFSYLDYFRDVFRHRKFGIPDFSVVSDWKINDFNAMMDLDRTDEELSAHQEPLFLTCKAVYEAFVSYQPTEIKIQMINGDRKDWARYPSDKAYLETLIPLFPVDKQQYEEVNLKERDYVPKYLGRIKFVYKNVFDRVEYVSHYAPVGRNYWNLNGANYNLRNIFKNLKHEVSNYKNLFNFSELRNYIGDTCYMASFTNSFYATLPQEGELKNLHIVKNLFGNRSFHVEVILGHAMVYDRFMTCKYIIKNFDLDIGYFQHLWNIFLTNIIKIKEPIIEILRIIRAKYPKFKVFISCLESQSQLESIDYPYIVADKIRCVSFKLLQNLKQVKKIKGNTIKNYFNTDLNKIGKYRFSPLSLDNIDSFPSCTLETQDVFGVTPFMHKRLKDTPLSIKTITMEDNYGNNFLHYFFSQSSRMYGSIKNYRACGFSKEIPDNVFLKLEQAENKFGWTPAELAAINGWSSFMFKPNPHTKKFNYKYLETLNNRDFAKFKTLDGLNVNLKILCAASGFIKDTNDSFYQNINNRDENGKHLIHYFPSISCLHYFPTSSTQNKSCLTPDENGSMLLHTCVDSYTDVLYYISKWENCPATNVSGYFDKLGFNRIMYYLLKTKNPYSGKNRIRESVAIGFDYSNENDAQLIHITVQAQDEHLCFKLERTSIPKITGGFEWYGGEEGDEISHFFMRLGIKSVLHDKYKEFELILNIWIKRGLKFNVVKNSRGDTALDLLRKFKDDNPNIQSRIFRFLDSVVKKKSLALAKFKLKPNSACPKTDIISLTDDLLVGNTHFTFYNEVSIQRYLYFE